MRWQRGLSNQSQMDPEGKMVFWVGWWVGFQKLPSKENQWNTSFCLKPKLWCHLWDPDSPYFAPHAHSLPPISSTLTSVKLIWVPRILKEKLCSVFTSETQKGLPKAISWLAPSHCTRLSSLLIFRKLSKLSWKQNTTNQNFPTVFCLLCFLL